MMINYAEELGVGAGPGGGVDAEDGKFKCPENSNGVKLRLYQFREWRSCI